MVARKKTTKAKKNNKPAPKKIAVKKKPTSKPVAISQKQAQDFPIVGIGASAGGLEAIEGFFSQTPSDTGMAFVIIQHLAPEHKSIMASLLKKYTEMKVVEIHDGTKIEPNCIYLNPPNKDVSIMNGKLYLLDPTQARGARLSIDTFFHSLAECQGDKSICVVLSGTGTDGTLGLKSIKGAGGMAMAQDETQARYDSMPKNAIDTGLVDYVLPVEKMASELLKYVKHPYIGSPKKISPSKEKFENNLQKIFVLIRSNTGHDFSHYKQNTIHRRIERRMAVHQLDKISEYVRYLQEDPTEIKALFKDLLITVTNFFRDTKAFKALNEKVVRVLLETRPRDTNIRVWVSGCATGEEAYSVAILFEEAMQMLKKHFNIQIFATDIDNDAIEYARQGVFSESIAADVSAERLKRFFVKEGTAYRVKKQIREMVVFATQNLIKDAPFSKLDLVCCRNLLIYLDSTLQKKVLPLFHYTLNPGGFLFLGTSETIGDFSDRYSPVDTKWKIFKRKDAIIDMGIERPVKPFYEAAGPVKAEKKSIPTAVNIRQMAERAILQNYAPPSVLIDEKLDILYFHGETDKYLTLPNGEPSFNILKMAREDLRYKLSNLLRKAAKEHSIIVSEGVKIKSKDEVETVRIIVRPVLETSLMDGFMMVTFESKPPAGKAEIKKKKPVAGKSVEPRLIALEQELQSTKEYLQTTIEELETSNEELKSTNEELQSTNEELQSTNEELETSREELQSTNEELETVNSELQDKVDQLSGSNNDLNNLLSSTEIATLFLDNELCIKRFTPKITNIFKLIGTDVGRPVSDITHNIDYHDLAKDVSEVLDNLGRIDKEVRSKDGTWFTLRILPYRTVDNAIDGVVITFIDITKQKISDLASAEARDYAQGIIQTVREPLVVLDSKLQIISANKSFYNVFKVKPEETENKLIYDLGNKQWDIPRLREFIETILPENTSFENFEVVHDFPVIGRRKMMLNGRRVFQGTEGTETILLAIEDISQDRE
ncbi:MAG: chemotaxis protein CheB [Planctomycetota bacterium]|jgi:two-component system CheB/CheR fusion protein